MDRISFICRPSITIEQSGIFDDPDINLWWWQAGTDDIIRSESCLSMVHMVIYSIYRTAIFFVLQEQTHAKHAEDRGRLSSVRITWFELPEVEVQGYGTTGKVDQMNPLLDAHGFPQIAHY